MTTNPTPADVDRLIAEVEAALEGVTPGPWHVDGEPWSQIVWSGAENRVCFMAHSNGLDDDRDIATARFIAHARQAVPALIAALRAMQADMALLEANKNAAHHWRRENLARAEAAEAKLAEVEKERDTFARANHLQANCIHLTAQALGPDYAATVDALPKAAAHVAATVATLTAQVEAMRVSAMKAMTIANGALDPTATEKTFRRDLVKIREELRGALVKAMRGAQTISTGPHCECGMTGPCMWSECKHLFVALTTENQTNG